MNKAYFSDSFLRNCFFEACDCSTNNHCKQTFKSFVSRDNLLLWSDGFRPFKRETVNLWAQTGKPRGTFGHLWPSHFLFYWWNLSKINAIACCQTSPGVCQALNQGQSRKSGFALCCQGGEPGGCLSPRVFSQPWSGLFRPGVNMRWMVPIYSWGKGPRHLSRRPRATWEVFSCGVGLDYKPLKGWGRGFFTISSQPFDFCQCGRKVRKLPMSCSLAFVIFVFVCLMFCRGGVLNWFCSSSKKLARKVSLPVMLLVS